MPRPTMTIGALATAALLLAGCATTTSTSSTSTQTPGALQATQLSFNGPNSILVTELLELSATSNSSGALHFSVHSDDLQVCAIVAGTSRITGLAVGTCRITVQQDATSTHTAAQIEAVVTVNAPSATHSAVAPLYSLAFRAGAGITLEGEVDQGVLLFENSRPVTATAGACYRFSGWETADGRQFSSNRRLVISSVTQNGYYRAVAVSAPVEVRYIAYDGGLVARTTAPATKTSFIAGLYSCGSTADSITAVPNIGFEFTGWDDGSSNNPRQDRPTAPATYTAQFAKKRFAVTYAADANGSISGNVAQTVTYGGDATSVTAVADTGYRFLQWSDGVATATRTDTNVQSAINVTASFGRNSTGFTGGDSTGFTCPNGAKVATRPDGSKYCT